ncbi:MAG: ATP-binding protein [Thermodesulfobacteriota bacterium]
MVTKLNISGFKGFEKLELPRLSRFTLLGGRNNVGKTSVLEAVFMFFDRLNPQMILRQFDWRGVNAVSLEPDTLWAPVFFNYDLGKPMAICAVIDGSEEKMTVKFNPNYVEPGIQAKASDSGMKPLHVRTDQKPIPSYALDIEYRRKQERVQVSHMLIGPSGIGLRIDHAKVKQRAAVFLVSRMHVNPSEDAERFGQLDIVGQQDRILEFLRLVEPKLKSLSSIAMGDTSLIHGDIGLSRKIPVSYMGEGVSRLLSIILAIATSKNGVVLIDECENGIHYSIMSKVWEAIGKAAREFDCQVIGTTHSYECLRSAYEGFGGELKQDFSYVRLDRIDDNVVAKTFEYELLKTAIESGMEVR